MPFKIAACLGSFIQLNQAIFSCYLAGDYQERHYFYEKQFHEMRKNVLSSILKLRRVAAKPFSDVVTHLENTYGIFLSLGLLLYRIHDHATFQAAQKEFSDISDNITLFLQYLMAVLRKKTLPIMASSLTESIMQLEDVTQNALWVVANDPAAFSIFIHDLRVLDEVLMQLSTDISVMDRS